MATDCSDAALSPGVALVTGAAGIVGPGIVQSLREGGWQVAAADLSMEQFEAYRKLFRKPHPGSSLFAADLSRRDECFRLVEEVRSRLGPIRLLVHAATGHCRRVKLPFDRFDESTAHAVFDVDLLGGLFLVQAAVEQLSQQQGLVIQFSSVRTEEFPVGSALYSSVKAAVETFTQALAVELSPHNVRVNAIRIGSIPEAEFLRKALAPLPDELARELLEEVMASYVEDSPEPSLTGRAGTPADAGNLVAFLASDAATFINGAVIPLDGAYHSARRRLVTPPAGPLKQLRRWRTAPQECVREWLEARKAPASTEALAPVSIS